MKDFLGAFADGAILFPLIAALSLQGSMPIDLLLFTAGLAYIVSGLWFRIPMPVQPLKSIAIAAVAVHATGLEIRISGALLGAVCLLLALVVKNPKLDSWMRLVPPFFIRALQTALGVILIMQGLKVLSPLSILEKAAGVITLVIVFLFSSLPLLGIVATVGLVVGVWLNMTHPHGVSSTVATAGQNGLRLGMVASLVIPQIALTFANSVLSTRDVAHQYFGEQARKVTERNLLNSIGLGNIIVAVIGGLPFCHGAGGLTSHYRGGARTYRANLIIGSALLVFAAITYFGQSVVLQYPLFLLGSLLVAIGWFHFGLVRMSHPQAKESFRLLLVAFVAAFAQNMTWPLVAAVILCFPYKKILPMKRSFA